MIGVLVRAAGLAAVYLLVLTSVEPADVALAAILGLAVALLLRPKRGRPAPERARPSLSGLAVVLAQTAAEMTLGSWRTARFCLGAPMAPGFVELPRGDRTDAEVAFWGVLTGEAPDEIPVDVDEVGGVLVVHLLDARDPDAVRARHRRTQATLRDGPRSRHG